MYPNLYYVFKALFGVEWKFISFANTFGVMVALAFFVSGWVLFKELERKQKEGLLNYIDKNIVLGKPASIFELVFNFLFGFLFGFKILGVILSRPDEMKPQDYLFSGEGNLFAGLGLGLLIAGLKWYEKNKVKLAQPQISKVRLWPKDRVGDIVVIALIGGVLGAKLFDGLENWDSFIQHPIKSLFAQSGLTFYGGLIVAALSIIFFAFKNKIQIKHLVDAAAPAILIGYAIGRIGCQLAGDGDWGVYNSAYYSPEPGKVALVTGNEFEQAKQKNANYIVNNILPKNKVLAVLKDSAATQEILKNVKHIPFKKPFFLPTWMVAFTYTQNVNNDGVVVESIKDDPDYNSALPMPVFPTPFYETIACFILFLILWGLRKKIKVPTVIFGIYLIFVGVERWLIEKIRVNNIIKSIGLTQAELISLILVFIGIVIIAVAYSKKEKK